MTNHALAPVTVTSFGYGHQDTDGRPVPPPAAHLTIDVRTHFRDPHVSPGLRHLTGTDEAVIDAVMATPGVHALIDAILDAVTAFRTAPVPSPVTVAVGCVGGRHRSVVIASFIAALLPGKVGLVHRDIARPVITRPVSENPADRVTDQEPGRTGPMKIVVRAWTGTEFTDREADAMPSGVPGLVIHRAVDSPGLVLSHAGTGLKAAVFPDGIFWCAEALGELGDWTATPDKELLARAAPVIGAYDALPLPCTAPAPDREAEWARSGVPAESPA
jgi:UPF0042 nucleotide-binding protein